MLQGITATTCDCHTRDVATVTFRDETATGKALHSFEVLHVPDSITVRELVRLRVREEVARYNAAPTSRFQGLVRPADAEVELNGYRLARPRRLDWEQQADAACAAFERNGFFASPAVIHVEGNVSCQDAGDAQPMFQPLTVQG